MPKVYPYSTELSLFAHGTVHDASRKQIDGKSAVYVEVFVAHISHSPTVYNLLITPPQPAGVVGALPEILNRFEDKQLVYSVEIAFQGVWQSSNPFNQADEKSGFWQCGRNYTLSILPYEDRFERKKLSLPDAPYCIYLLDGFIANKTQIQCRPDDGPGIRKFLPLPRLHSIALPLNTHLKLICGMGQDGILELRQIRSPAHPPIADIKLYGYMFTQHLGLR